MRTITVVLVSLLLSASPSIAQTMNASWYGPGFQGKRMANHMPFNMYAHTVAHKTLPLGAKVCITNLKNGRYIEARVTDRGPYKIGRDIDLSYAVAKHLGIIPKGTGKVEVVRC